MPEEKPKKVDRIIKVRAHDLTRLIRKGREAKHGGFRGNCSYTQMISELQELGLTYDEIKQCL